MVPVFPAFILSPTHLTSPSNLVVFFSWICFLVDERCIQVRCELPSNSILSQSECFSHYPINDHWEQKPWHAAILFDTTVDVKPFTRFSLVFYCTSTVSPYKMFTLFGQSYQGFHTLRDLKSLIILIWPIWFNQIDLTYSTKTKFCNSALVYVGLSLSTHNLSCTQKRTYNVCGFSANTGFR